MQNTKIQTLWNLCHALKEKRQFLIEKIKHTQDYLNHQQWHLSKEVHNLRQQIQHLSAQVLSLEPALETLYTLWRTQEQHKHSQKSAHTDILLNCTHLHHELFWRFYELACVLQQLKLEISLEKAPEIFQAGLQELLTEFQEQSHLFRQSSAELNRLHAQALAVPTQYPDFSVLLKNFNTFSEFLEGFSEELQGFQSQWQASAPYRRQPLDSSAEITRLQQEVDTLQIRIQDLQTEKAWRDQWLAHTHEQTRASTAALAELKHQHQALSEQMHVLLHALESFQHLFQKNILSARSSLNTETETNHEEETQDFVFSPESQASERQVVREAVQENSRKHIVQILKKRFNKVPRRVHHLLRKIETSHRLDKLFELALARDSLDQWINDLEENTR